MEYFNKSFLEQSSNFSYGLHDYLALKPIEYDNSVGDYSEKVDYTCM